MTRNHAYCHHVMPTFAACLFILAVFPGSFTISTALAEEVSRRPPAVDILPSSLKRFDKNTPQEEESLEAIIFEEESSQEQDLSRIAEKTQAALQKALSHFTYPWNKVPFDQRPFTYPVGEPLKKAWPRLMRSFEYPYPDAQYIRERVEKIPQLQAQIPGWNPNFDYETYARQVQEVWSLFFRGDFQEARQKGYQLGAFGVIPGAFSQINYAIYLTETQGEKAAMLEEVSNIAKLHLKLYDEHRNDEMFKYDIMMMLLGYSYSIGRIAEEAPVAVSLAKGYVKKVRRTAEEILETTPNNPIALAFLAGVDANIMRKVGKATGRITYGAKTQNADEYFKKALERSPDQAILRYEYANSLLYMYRKRKLNEAIEQFRLASRIPPTFAMEALDSMYAYKRMDEVIRFRELGKSFRSFERNRAKDYKKDNKNLYNVLLRNENDEFQL